MTHWTTQDTDSLIRRITFDFWTQLQKRMDVLPVSQLDLANLFGVSESAISQTFNNSKNPRLKTLVSYAKALKLKVAIVPYADDDPAGRPVNSEIFTICWEKAGRPRSFGQAGALPTLSTASNFDSLIVVPDRKGCYPVRAKQAGTAYQGDVQQMLFFSGHGASFRTDTEEMPTAITAPNRNAA